MIFVHLRVLSYRVRDTSPALRSEIIPTGRNKASLGNYAYFSGTELFHQPMTFLCNKLSERTQPNMRKMNSEVWDRAEVVIYLKCRDQK